MSQYRESRYTPTPPPKADRIATYVDDFPLFQWATRWETAQRDAEGEPIKKSGWVTAKGRDEDLDAVLAKLGIPFFDYTHSGSKNKATYWHVRAGWFYVLALGVQTTWDMDKDIAARSGIAYARNQGGTGDSVVRAVAFFEAAYDAGYKQPVRITASKGQGYLAFLPALIDHYVALKKLAELKGTPDVLPAYYEVGVGLGTGELSEWGQTNVIPIAPTRPKDIDRDYLAKHYIDAKARRGMFDQIEAPGDDGKSMLDHVIEWSIEESDRIYRSAGRGESIQGANPDARSFLAGKTPTLADRRGESGPVVEDLPF